MHHERTIRVLCPFKCALAHHLARHACHRFCSSAYTLNPKPWLIIWLAMLVTGFVLVPKPAHDVCTLVYTTVSVVRN